MFAFRKCFILVLVLVMLFFASCQNTPEKAAVASKNDDAEEYDSADIEKSKTQLTEQLDSRDYHVKMDIAANDKVMIAVDADVIIPDLDDISVVRVSPANLTVEHLDTLVNLTCGDNPVYYRELTGTTKWSKEEIENMILYIDATLSSDKLREQGEYGIGASKTALQNEYSSAKSKEDERLYDFSAIEGEKTSRATYYELKSYMGSDRAADICLRQSEDKKWTNLSFENHNYFEWIKHTEPYSKEEAEKIDLSYVECRNIAEDAVLKLDGEDSNLKLCKTSIVYIGNFELELEKEECEIEYRFTFGREYNGLIIEGQSAILTEENIEYCGGAGTERLSIMVGKDGITDFTWSDYTKFEDVVAEDVYLIDFETVMDRFESQMNYKFTWTPSFNSGDNIPEDTTAVIYVDEVWLNVMLIEEKDNPDCYIMVPVWDFIGDEEYNQVHVHSKGDVFDGLKNISILTINAIDGTVIDRIKGY